MDRISILRLKQAQIPDAAARQNVERACCPYGGSAATVLCDAALDALVGELQAVNEELWDIEDDIRACEGQGDFGPRFVELARSVYLTNDRRSAIKRRINEVSGSAIMEEKLYNREGIRRP